MPDDFNPLDDMRALAAATPTPDTTEFGLGTRSLPVKSNDDTPLAVKLRGPSLRPAATPAAVLADVALLEATLPIDEWRRFRMAAGRSLGFIPHRGDHDDGAD